MKVKVGKFLFDTNHIPVMLVLSEQDKANIAAMDPEANSFCSFPDGFDHKAVQNWMGDEDVVQVNSPEDLERMFMPSPKLALPPSISGKTDKSLEDLDDTVHG